MDLDDYEYKMPLLQRPFLEGRELGLRKGEVKGRAAGRAEAKAEAILQVLAGRGIALSDSQRERVISCDDLGILNIWISRVGVVESAKGLLG
ncbi:hypothetical protein ACFOVU_28135 [Nocardiopsis sediminis]|uniref:Resolvase/invertase-type recombinase catalytic domain-containing protein n=1 Tax=Nocardiopsis sediminis TaxID=1778267 RepID=A0ABV8FUH4_9ACTN